MKLVDILGSVRRHWRLSASIFLVAILLLLVFLVTRDQVQPTPRTQADVQVLIPARGEDGERPPGVPSVLLQGQVGLALETSTQTAALDGAGLTRAERRDVKFDVGLPDFSDILYLSASARSSEVAQRAVNSYAESVIAARREAVRNAATRGQANALTTLATLENRLEEVEAELVADGVPLPAAVTENLEEGAGPVEIPIDGSVSSENLLKLRNRNKLLNEIERQRDAYSDLNLQVVAPRSYAEVVERQRPVSITPAPPTPVIPIVLALGVGLLLAIAVPFLRDLFDHTIKDASTASELFAAPVLAAIPAWPRGVVPTVPEPGTDHDRAYRTLASTSVATDRMPRNLLVTSPVGTSQDSMAASFAVALADIGVRVVLVGTGPRHAWFSGAAPAERLEGHRFPDLLVKAQRGALPAGLVAHLASHEVENLFVVAPGLDNGPLALDGLPPLLDALATDGTDVVIIAGPPFLEDPDATIFAWATRHVLWSIRTGEVTDAQAREAASRLELAGVTPFGLALIGRES